MVNDIAEIHKEPYERSRVIRLARVDEFRRRKPAEIDREYLDHYRREEIRRERNTYHR